MSLSRSIRRGTTLVRFYRFAKIKNSPEKSNTAKAFSSMTFLAKTHNTQNTSTKANGPTIKNPALAFKSSSMAQSITATITIINPMAEGSSPMLRDKCMRVNGRMAWKREKGSGKGWVARRIWGSGNVVSPRGMVCSWQRMAIGMRESIRMPSNMERAFKGLLMVIFIRGFSKTEPPVVMASTTGKTRAISRVTFPTDFAPVKASGKRRQEFLTNTKANTKTIKNGATVYLHGLTATYSKETTRETSETVMVKCSGLMAVSTKASGKTEFRMEKVSFSFNSG